MATYKFGRYETWDGVDYFAIHKKGFFGNWSEQKYWVVPWDDYNGSEARRLNRLMMESVDRLIKAGHTVI